MYGISFPLLELLKLTVLSLGVYRINPFTYLVEGILGQGKLAPSTLCI